MKTKRLQDTQNGLADAAKILKSGGIVAIPTETVYGLAASAYDEKAIERVFEAKGRPQDNPLIVHIADMDMLSMVARDVPDAAYMLAKRFWPGPLTMVLPRGDKIPPSVSAGLSTVAVRMPENEAAKDIIKLSGLPLAAPSANVSGSPSPTAPEHVLCDLDGRIDAVVMSERCAVGVESTVVTLCTDPPRLLRPGGITVEQLREVLPDIKVDSAVLSEPEKDKPVASPGMKYKHYSPQTCVTMVDGESADFIEFVNQKSNCGALCFAGEDEKINHPAIVYGTQGDGASQAARLFDALREADTLGVSEVFVHAPDKNGIGLAVYNRLIRAAEFKVIRL